MLDKNRMRQHHFEVSYVLGRFLTEHFIRVYKAFDGDLTAAIVLGTIGQYNYRRYYTEIGNRAPEGFHRLVEKGEHLDYARPCNATYPALTVQHCPQNPHIRRRTAVVLFADPRIQVEALPVSSIQALRRSIAACVCTLTLLATPAMAAPQAPPQLVAVGQVLPDVVMAGLNGPHKPLSSYRGRPLIINVWASWCAPCRKEAASLERLAWSKAGSGYTVIGISTDDDRNAALKWLRHSNATISHYIDSGPRWTLEHMLGASTIPVTVLVDAEGRVVARFRGARDWDTTESIQLIERAFAGRGRTAAAR